MSDIPADCKYSSTHEWFKLDGDEVTVGITQFAADELTDITFVDLPEVGKEVAPESVIGEIESVKATSDLMCAVGGTVTAVNEKLSDSPELVNNDPFNEGWMVKLKVTDPSPLEKLMDASAYEATL